MQTIELTVPEKSESDIVLHESSGSKRKAVKTFMSYAGILVGVFVMFAVVVVMTVDIRLITSAEIAELGLDFFIILFCSYLMYVTCSDSGMRAALSTDEYKEQIYKYEEAKNLIVSAKLQGRLGEFCCSYIERELKAARIDEISAVGISYELYEAKYLGRDKDAVEAEKSLSKAQRKAIVRANSHKPIKLTPDMIMKRGRSAVRRSPLGVNPQKRKRIGFVYKFFANGLVSILLAVIAFEVVADPSLAVFASVLMKMISVVANGFAGYKMGYDNILIHTANYTEDQADLLKQAYDFFMEVENGTQLQSRDKRADEE